MKRTILAVAFLLIGTAAFAAPSSIGDCEKIADPDAYNRCLAAFGPAAKEGRTVQPEPANADQPKMARRSRGKGRYAMRSSRGGKSFARGGRMRMVLDVGGSSQRSKGTRARGRRR